jgi:hypothetical protein
MTRVVGLLLFGIAACGSKSAEPKVDPKAAVGFTRALSALAGVDPTQSASLIAQGAYETVAPSEKCLESFAAAATERARVEALLDCGLACTLDAIQGLKGKEPRTWMAHLAGACEPSHFGLETATAALLSPEWFLLHKIGQIAAPHIEAATGADRAALDQALAAFRPHMPLPALARALYELPVVPEAVSVPVATRTYVIVSSDGTLRVGATPYGQLGPRGAVMAAPEGRALFPGNEVALGDLPVALGEAAGAPPPGPLDAGPPTIGAIVAGVGGDIDPGLRGDLGRSAGKAPTPLLMADGSRLAAEVIETAVALDTVLVAVAGPQDPAARALAVELERWKLVSGTWAAGDLRLYLAAPEEPAEALVDIERQRPERVIISAEGPVTWRDAVVVAGAAIGGGAKRITFTTPAIERANPAGGTPHRPGP